MKKSLLTILICVFTIVNLKAQDLPNPPANLQTLPSGSYVIAMDNSLQGVGNLGTYAKFNMKTYGLIVHLLNNSIKLKWVISAGKVKDAIDFTVNAELVKPSFVAAVSRDFKAGPFVIFSSDTIGLSSLINSYYTTQGLTGNNRPNIFRTTASVTVDIRYSYDGFKPRAAILNDGGNQNIHRDYFIAAGVPAQNYSILGALNLDSCYSFASEPHNSKTGVVVDSTVANIKRFILTGRNFLAQCHAITTYENNSLGRFQTTNGIIDVNNNLGVSVTVPNPDLAFYQYEGMYHASDGGSVKNWRFVSGSTNLNNSYTKIKGNGADTITFGATVSKTGTGLGGLVFYIGNHSFDVSNEQNISGMRMYMNAFLIPTQLPGNCLSKMPLPVRLTSFQGNLNNNKVNLEWAVAENEIAEKFELEKSIDGVDFHTAAMVFTSEKTGTEKYQYAETMNTEKIYYRLRMTDKSGRVTYSMILAFQTKYTLAESKISILNNPATERLSFSFPLNNNQLIDIKVIDLLGRVQMKQTTSGSQGINNINIQLPVALQTGMYILEVTGSTDRFTSKFVKN